MSIGTKIRKLRIQNKLSHEELAHKLNVAQTSISNFEADKTIPDFLIIQRLSDLFEVGLEYFKEDNDKEKYVFKNNEKNNIIVGKIEILNNNLPEGILENMLKRIELLEAAIYKK